MAPAKLFTIYAEVERLRLVVLINFPPSPLRGASGERENLYLAGLLLVKKLGGEIQYKLILIIN